MKVTLYKVMLCWHGELHTYWTYAKSGPDARRNAITKLAKKLEVRCGYCNSYFISNSNAWNVIQA